MTKIVHCKEEPYDIYIGRGRCPQTGLVGIWGNPFVIGQHGTREEVINKYRDWIIKQPEILKHLYLLKDKVLGCWCGKNACHGNVLEELLNMHKVAIVGSRGFSDYELFVDKTCNYISSYYDKYAGMFQNIEIVSGGCPSGADFLAAKFAKEYGIKMTEFLPDWDGLGKSAGFKRNVDIVNYADIVIAFWNSTSKGTQHSLRLAKEQKKDTIIIYV